MFGIFYAHEKEENCETFTTHKINFTPFCAIIPFSRMSLKLEDFIKAEVPFAMIKFDNYQIMKPKSSVDKLDADKTLIVLVT
jgi:hypothetical protein